MPGSIFCYHVSVGHFFHMIQTHRFNKEAGMADVQVDNFIRDVVS